MTKGNNFGTFAGVFTPSILTILGVIMFMRLPWIVGSGGLLVAVLIILVAHVISVTTGLSVSSISTDKSVQGGGPYYIVSRSLGLSLGGTVGLALFVGLSFSISLYVIGFSESLLGYFDLELTPYNIRVCGSITLVLLTTVTFISTSLAIKTQFVILAAIVLSLLSIFMGPGLSEGAPLQTVESAPISSNVSAIWLFGLFFPAVTGFTAGVNMSGDLKDPRKAIPTGTMWAIFVGLGTYLGLAIFLALTVPADQLTKNPEILLDIAFSPELVVAGVWGATLSSALGSIMGAPRILQALALDRIAGRMFGRGQGRTNEPRNALILSFFIAEMGIVIAELDVIARIVSMFFLATYGFLNLSCAIETWASPDFRPDFEIPKWISVLGAVTCVLVMIQLDLLATIGATILLTGLFLFLKRRELTLDTGDTWEGVWSSIVRVGLHRLRSGRFHHRNWRPNILLFTRHEANSRVPLLALGQALVRHRGVLTDLEFIKSGQKTRAYAKADELQMGVFHRRILYENAADSMSQLCRHYGFAGVEPNTVLLDWNEHRIDPKGFIDVLNTIKSLDFNLLMLAKSRRRDFGEHQRLDIWWTTEDGELPLNLSLLRFITSSDEWCRSNVRFLMVSTDIARADTLLKNTRRLLNNARIDATVHVINNVGKERSFEELVRRESASADLTIIGVPPGTHGYESEFIELANRLVNAVASLLIIRTAAEMLQPKAVTASAGESEEIDSPLTSPELPALWLPETTEIANETSRFAKSHEDLVTQLAEGYLKALYTHHVALVDRLNKVVGKYFVQLEKGLESDELRRREKMVSRAQSAFWFQTRKLMSDFEAADIAAQQVILENAVEWLQESLQVFQSQSPLSLEVVRPIEEFADHPADSNYSRRFKRWRRFLAWIRRQPITYTIPLTQLQRWYLGYQSTLLCQNALQRFGSHSFQLTAELGRLLVSLKSSLTMAGAQSDAGGLSTEDLSKEKERVLSELNQLTARIKAQIGEQHDGLLMRSRELSQELARDLDRVDVLRFIHRERRVSDSALEEIAHITSIPITWARNQTMVMHRNSFALLIAALQHRVATIVQRTRNALNIQLQSGIQREYDNLLIALRNYLEEINAGREARLKLALNLQNQFDDKQAMDDLIREIHGATGDLPEALQTVGDDDILQLEKQPFEAAEVITVALRSLMQHLVETELIGSLQMELSDIPIKEQRAIGVAQDVVRLISFNFSDFELAGDDTDEAFAAQMTAVIENGIERLEAEQEQLRIGATRLFEQFNERLANFMDRTDAYALTGSPDTMKHYVSSQESAVLSRFGEATRRFIVGIKSALTTLLYRRSAGILLARRLRAPERSETVVDHILKLVTAQMPEPATIAELPFYYRQLFLGASKIPDEFWVGRDEELKEAARAVENYRRGYQGALLVTGERGSGKSAMSHKVAVSFFNADRIHHVNPPPGGSVEPAVFKRTLEEAVSYQGDYREIFQTLQEGSVVIFHDLELWWERSDEGLVVIDEILDLIDRFGSRCFFILNLDVHAMTFISRLRALADGALALVECGPFDAEALRDIISLRHRSTDLRFKLDGREEDNISRWRQARLFAGNFDHSGGYVGGALQTWVSHIDKVDKKSLFIRMPKAPRLEELDNLRIEWVALILQMVLHKQVTFVRLLRITGLSEKTLRHDLDTLIRMGLVSENRQGVIGLNRYIHQMVTSRLIERGMLV